MEGLTYKCVNILALSTEVTVVPPSRLMTLLNECATWQQHQGLLPPDTKFDIFRDAAAAQQADNDSPAFHRYSTIKVINIFIYNKLFIIITVIMACPVHLSYLS